MINKFKEFWALEHSSYSYEFAETELSIDSDKMMSIINKEIENISKLKKLLNEKFTGWIKLSGFNNYFLHIDKYEIYHHGENYDLRLGINYNLFFEKIEKKIQLGIAELSKSIDRDKFIIQKYEGPDTTPKIRISDTDPYGEEDWSEFESVEWWEEGDPLEDPLEDRLEKKPKKTNDFITDDDFRKFLKDNNCYQEYIDNFSGDFSGKFSSIYDKKNYIMGAFRWAKSSQGSSYWQRIHFLWTRTL